MLSLLVLTALLQQGAPAPPTRATVPADPRLREYRESLIDAVRSGHIPSVSVSVRESGRTVWEESIGWANRERAVAATPATSYALGSLSKSLTGTTVLALADRGVVSLDAPVDRWLALRHAAGAVGVPTLRQLLDASGGIPHGWRSVPLEAMPASRESWDAWLADNAPVVFTPGTVFEYSNLSFGVAARVAERVTGRDFGEVIAERLFRPLGMAGSSAYLLAGDEVSAATPYDGGGAPLPRVAVVPEAGLGMYATAPDLARFGAFVLGREGRPGGEVFSPAAHAMLWRNATGPSGSFFHFGFWHSDEGLTTNGNIAGANAHLSIDRERQLVVAVTVNQTGSEADRAAGAILDALRGPPDPQAPSRRTAYAATYRTPYRGVEGILGEWRGTVEADGVMRPFTLVAGADSVRVQIADGAWVTLGRPTLNRFGELRGALAAGGNTPLPAAYAGTPLSLTLSWEGGAMRGYLLPQGTTAVPLPELAERER